jgi:hypothetical protein
VITAGDKLGASLPRRSVRASWKSPVERVHDRGEVIAQEKIRFHLLDPERRWRRRRRAG